MKTNEPDLKPVHDSIEIKFLFAEYESLTKRVDALMTETNDLAKYILIGVSGMYTWFATSNVQLSRAMWFLPSLFCLILGLRVLSITSVIVETGTFIAGIEDQLGIPKNLAWELNVKYQRESGSFWQRNSPRFLSALGFWVILFIVTCLISLYQVYQQS